MESGRESVEKAEYEYCKTTLVNLKRFIKYKKKYI